MQRAADHFLRNYRVIIFLGSKRPCSSRKSTHSLENQSPIAIPLTRPLIPKAANSTALRTLEPHVDVNFWRSTGHHDGPQQRQAKALSSPSASTPVIPLLHTATDCCQGTLALTPDPSPFTPHTLIQTLQDTEEGFKETKSWGMEAYRRSAMETVHMSSSTSAHRTDTSSPVCNCLQFFSVISNQQLIWKNNLQNKECSIL